MKFGLLCACVACVAYVHAGTYTVPVTAIARDAEYAKAKRSDGRIHRAERWRAKEGRIEGQQKKGKPDQTVLDAEKGDGEKVKPEVEDKIKPEDGDKMKPADRPVPIWDWEELTYVMVISVGSVPQGIRALLSISDTDIFIPSKACKKDCGGHQLYDPGISSTNNSDGKAVVVDYYRCGAMGVVSSDHLTINSVSIPDQWFIETHGMSRNTAFDWGNDEHDGLIGFAPSSEHSLFGAQNPFQNLEIQRQLDKNIFALRLPRGKNEPGEIKFGGLNEDLCEGEVRKLKLTDRKTKNAHDLFSATGRWQVSLTSISIGTGTAMLSNYTALLETDYPLITLPTDMAANIHYNFGFEHAGGQDTPLSINCEKRASLPNIIFKLEDNDFILTAFDYTLEVDNEEVGGRRCLSLFAAKGELETKEVVILGSAFLRNWYTVFDIERKTVGFTRLSKVEWTKVDVDKDPRWVQSR